MAYASASFLLSRQDNRTSSPNILSDIALLDPDASLDFLLFPSSATGNLEQAVPPPLPVNISSSVRELNQQEIELDRVIGEGSFGTVMKAKWREMNVAAKYFKHFSSSLPSGSNSPQAFKNNVDSSYLDEFIREIETMARVCNHMFIIQLVGIVKTPQLSVVTMFYENGSLEDILVRKSKSLMIPLDQSLLVRFALETAIGIRHLHLEGIIHRDLAARNLLVDDNFHIRVSDFGFSRIKEVGTTRGYTQSSLGPIRWSAPEAMRKKKYSEASDIFSFGVVLYEIFFQEMPWKGLDTVDVVIAVCGGERMPISPSENVPQVIIDLMSACWSHDPDARPQLTSIIPTLRDLKHSTPSSPPPSVFAEIRPSTQDPSESTSSTSPNSTPLSLSLSSLLSFPVSRGVHRDLSLEIVTEPFQQTWEEYHDTASRVDEIRPSPAPVKLQRETSGPSLLSDSDFLKLVEENKHHSWGHESCLRVMYLMLQESHRSSSTVEKILQKFQTIQKDGFHLTVIYFWIQVR